MWKLLVLVGGMLAGAYGGWTARDWKAGADETVAAQQVTRRVIAQTEVTEKASAGRDASRERIRTVFKTIREEVPVYVTREADDRCIVPVGFVRVYDAAAQAQPLPDTSGEPNDAPSGVPLSAVADTDVANLQIGHDIRDQLIKLQAFVADQAAVAAKK